MIRPWIGMRYHLQRAIDKWYWWRYRKCASPARCSHCWDTHRRYSPWCSFRTFHIDSGKRVGALPLRERWRACPRCHRMLFERHERLNVFGGGWLDYYVVDYGELIDRPKPVFADV